MMQVVRMVAVPQRRREMHVGRCEWCGVSKPRSWEIRGQLEAHKVQSLAVSAGRSTKVTGWSVVLQLSHPLPAAVAFHRRTFSSATHWSDKQSRLRSAGPAGSLTGLGNLSLTAGAKSAEGANCVPLPLGKVCYHQHASHFD